MGNTEPSDNTLHKTKHTSFSILSYSFGLNPVATPCLIGSIEKTRKVPGLILSNYITTAQGGTPQ